MALNGSAVAPAWLASPRVRLVAVAGSAALIGNAIAQAIRGIGDVAETDYLNFAVAGRILNSGSAAIYNPAIARANELAYVGRSLPVGTRVEFRNPPLAAELVRPLALLSPSAGMACMVVIGLLCLLAAGVMMGRWWAPADAGLPFRILLVVSAVAMLPAAWGIALGQWNSLLLLPAVGAIACLHRGRFVLAGLLLGALCLKPQLVWCVPILLLVARQWRVILGFLGGALIWLVGSVAVVGLSGVRTWVDVVLSPHEEATRPIGLPAFLEGVGSGLGVELVGAIVLVLGITLGAWHFRAVLRANPVLSIALGLGISIVCSPHGWPDDLLVLAIPLLLAASVRPGIALVGMWCLSAAYVIDLSLPRPIAHVEAIMAAACIVGVAAIFRSTAAHRLSNGGYQANGLTQPHILDR